MSDEAAFLAAIQAAPADDAPRLIYADWLDENGRAEQAEAIRVERTLRIARVRWEELRPKVDPDWLDRVFPASGLILRSVPPGRKIMAIKVIREILGIGILEAKNLSESTPVRLLPNEPYHLLLRAQASLRAAGADVELVYFEEPAAVESRSLAH